MKTKMEKYVTNITVQPLRCSREKNSAALKISIRHADWRISQGYIFILNSTFRRALVVKKTSDCTKQKHQITREFDVRHLMLQIVIHLHLQLSGSKLHLFLPSYPDRNFPHQLRLAKSNTRAKSNTKATFVSAFIQSFLGTQKPKTMACQHWSLHQVICRTIFQKLKPKTAQHFLKNITTV